MTNPNIAPIRATTVHRGPYEQIGPAYHTLTGWISEHGHDIAGPPREIYLNDPQMVPPEDLLTRVEFRSAPRPADQPTACDTDRPREFASGVRLRAQARRLGNRCAAARPVVVDLLQ
jgi:hypothetical protein